MTAVKKKREGEKNMNQTKGEIHQESASEEDKEM
jgi:hypothetical protein